MALTRYAPTPSGYLHAGNLRNLELTAEVAAGIGAEIALRIDDADAARYRREYVEDIFSTLERMGLAWTIGPRDVDDFEAHWSQRTRTEHYRTELMRARDRGLMVYACTCSRSQQRGPASGGCAGGCRSRGDAFEPGASALRVAVPRETSITVGEQRVLLDVEMGDFIIWRRDDLPAYQLVSVVEDRDLGTTHIVRGRDLLPSSAAQVFLAHAFGAPNVAAATYVHHELITDSDGRKLSKSRIPREGP